MNKTLKNIITAGAMASFALAPFAAFANDGADDENRGMGMRENAATFCEMIKDRSVDDLRHFGDRDDKMHDKWDDRDSIIAGIRAKFDDKRSDGRADQETKFDALIANWESNAKTDAERAAIADFKVSLATAMAERNTSVDASVTTSRTDTDATRAAARAKMEAALADLQAKMTTALTKAQTDCASGVSSATVRTNFAASAKSAIDAFKTATADIHMDAKTDIKSTHDERKSDVTEARSNFRGFWQSFAARLRAMFRADARVNGELETQ